ncbi:hypothetical protein SmJEL517_g01194 [Synchytrium microbalum]|uniref:Protein kinase domain-containing protein n=1 Tax=Synchytrium microbalum TaxID=1806994 RepID=A0A507CBH0_9FUNG|nr:uncharacterized protein SmJEL517_g01194 [Synchytrium microbalum]TPX36678.1 hypothetical protein SmJEL517_g01194 [Synchytrium microbalum]
MKALQHENIARLYDVYEDHHHLYLIIERAQIDLYEAITSRGGFSVDVSKNVFDQLCNGLLHCHDNGIYHRDIKPENVLISGTDCMVKLTDFGLATRETWSTELGCGSVRYMAPECLGVNGSKGYSTAANDVWSMGVILINLLFGKNPWHEASAADQIFGLYIGRHPDVLRDQFGLSREFDALLHRVFTLDIRKRISLRELRRAVAELNCFTSEEADGDYPLIFEGDDISGRALSLSTNGSSSHGEDDEVDIDVLDDIRIAHHGYIPPNVTPSSSSPAQSYASLPTFIGNTIYTTTTNNNNNHNTFKQRYTEELKMYNIDTPTSEDCDVDDMCDEGIGGTSWAEDFGEMDFSTPPFIPDVPSSSSDNSNSNNQDDEDEDLDEDDNGGEGYDYNDGGMVNESEEQRRLRLTALAKHFTARGVDGSTARERKVSIPFSIATHDSGFEDMTVDDTVEDSAYDPNEDQDMVSGVKPSTSFPNKFISGFLEALGSLGLVSRTSSLQS